MRTKETAFELAEPVTCETSRNITALQIHVQHSLFLSCVRSVAVADSMVTSSPSALSSRQNVLLQKHKRDLRAVILVRSCPLSRLLQFQLCFKDVVLTNLGLKEVALKEIINWLGRK